MFFKKMMMWMIFITILIAVSSNSWFVFWLTMEMNLMSFIPIMNNNTIKNCYSMVIYFIIQSFSSSLFFLSSFQYYLNFSLIFLIFINLALLIKLAMIPFHFWIMMIANSMNFNALFMLLSFQKMIPLFIISKFFFSPLIIIVIISTLMSSVMALNLKQINKLLILSSISHQGWMMCLISKKINFWLVYLIVYSTIIYSIISTATQYKLNYMEMNSLAKMNVNEKLLLISNFLSLGGMPPFIGFFVKIMTIFLLMKSYFPLIVFLIISSLINLFFYLKILTPSFFFFIKFLKNSKYNFNSKTVFVNMNYMLLIFLINFILY
uniref:NADH dehydrogenase subunit 2 n=1 Tax=Dermacentor albipictus TaxID=60249 RepID=UPI0021D5320A|nr:NADH dehydrogenase subunit 2 [Dermacentor albipictus]UXG58563.1 NADH dehydrogenase subunit 2 [Dermacentor albipictus]UXG58670.1 NADH dehydrogenase subunit 2 [Dermacentor albipictus]